jgi:Ca2+-binding EF-hand superfamily protein
MNRTRLLLASFMLISFSALLAQEGGDGKKQKKGKNGDDEDAKMFKLIEKSYKKSETERDKVIKEFAKLDSDRPRASDYLQWYRRVAGDGAAWNRADISSKQIAEIYDRMAARLELSGGSISRDEFLRYAREFWGPDKSPPWKDGKGIDLGNEAQKLFKHLDRDRDDMLSGDEIPPLLRANMRRWDVNGDGIITFEEYGEYFRHRLESLHRDLVQPMLPPVEIQAGDERPAVIRQGKLPPGLPAWFAQLDTDGDGQVALYEWRLAGWDLDEFARLDLNDDGLLDAGEVLRLLSLISRDGTRPFAYLATKQVGAKNSRRP